VQFSHLELGHCSRQAALSQAKAVQIGLTTLQAPLGLLSSSISMKKKKENPQLRRTSNPKFVFWCNPLGFEGLISPF